MNHIKEDKIQLICYCADDIQYQKRNDKLALVSSLKIIPYDSIFTDEEMKNIINMLLIGSPTLKITIEKVEE